MKLEVSERFLNYLRQMRDQETEFARQAAERGDTVSEKWHREEADGYRFIIERYT